MPDTPPPLTDRQEIFCRHVARGASGAAAARWAGYAPDSAAKQASVMLDRPHIRRRVENLRVRREIARQTGIAEMVDRLRALAKLATAKGDYRTAVRCIEFEARATGLIPDKNAASPCGGFAGSDPLLDGIDPRWPGHAAAEADAWLAEWRRGLVPEPEPEETPEPIIVPHVYEGFEGRPLDEFTPYTDLERMRPAGPAPHEDQRKGMKGKEREPSVDAVDDEDPDPIASREARAEAALEAELVYLRSIAPPIALNPAAPAWARHPDPMVRGAQSDLHGWDPDWERPG